MLVVHNLMLRLEVLSLANKIKSYLCFLKKSGKHS